MRSEGDLRRCSWREQHKPRAAFPRNGESRDGSQSRRPGCLAARHRERPPAGGRGAGPRSEVSVARGRRCACGKTRPRGDRIRDRTAPDGPVPLRRFCRVVKGGAECPGRQHGLTEVGQAGPVARRRAPHAICSRAPAVHVDHCRGAGKVRGMPCFNRHWAISTLGDDPDAVRRAAAYLEGTSWKPTLVVPGVCQLPS